MVVENAENRSSKDRENRDIRDSQSRSGCMGAFSQISSKHGNDSVRACGENSEKSDSTFPRERSDSNLAGKIASQLVSETEKQLAYHEQQAEILRERLEELKQLPGFSTTDIHEHD